MVRLPEQPAGTTVWAATGLLLLAIVYAVDAVIGLVRPDLTVAEAIQVGIPVGSASGVSAALKVVVLIVAAVYLRLGIGMLQRRGPVREGVLFVTGVLGAIGAVFAVSGFLTEPPAPNRFAAVATALTNLTILVLAWHPRTRDDVAAAERRRLRGSVLR